MKIKNSIRLARFMHTSYEKISKEKSWNTQKKCKVSFSKLPKENQEVMIEVARLVLLWVANLGIEGHDDFYNYICINKKEIKGEGE